MTAVITTSGLQNITNPTGGSGGGGGGGTSVIPPIQWAIAQGTSDAVTAVYPIPNLFLTDGLLLAFRASAANQTPTPTFAPDGLPAANITKGGGQVLANGDIPGARFEAQVRYNLTSNVWELQNPWP